jgi:mono/diheme cytochrome c family protein
MRRVSLLIVLLASALAFVAAGCGGEQTQTASPETVKGETPTTETTTTETSTTPKGDPVAGKAIFTGASGCTGCHTLADAGSSGTVGPNLDDAKPSFDLAYDRVTNGQGGMPSFQTSLTDQQRADVAAYVSSVAGQ